MEAGMRIHYLRRQNEMTLEDLGNKIGVGKSTVKKWESGTIANMRGDHIIKVADALNVSPTYLMGWEDSEPTKKILYKSPLRKRYRKLTSEETDDIEYISKMYLKLNANDKEFIKHTMEHFVIHSNNDEIPKVVFSGPRKYKCSKNMKVSISGKNIVFVTVDTENKSKPK